VANNLLKQGEPFLCLQCHEMHVHNARAANSAPYTLPSGGSKNYNGNLSFMAAFNTRCRNCHNKVHGSDLLSQGVTGRGAFASLAPGHTRHNILAANYLSTNYSSDHDDADADGCARS